MNQKTEDGRISPHIQLSALDQASLLQLAREAITAHLLQDQAPDSPYPSPSLAQKAGVFVTLRCQTEGELMLRGCIGQVQAEQPLFKSVPQMAIKAHCLSDSIERITHSICPVCISASRYYRH